MADDDNLSQQEFIWDYQPVSEFGQPTMNFLLVAAWLAQALVLGGVASLRTISIP